VINTTATIGKGCSIEQTGLITVVTAGIINHIKYGRHYLEMTSRKLLERIEKDLIGIYEEIDIILAKLAEHLEELEELEEDLTDDDFSLNFDDEEY
jgi:hypothetical protein